MAQIYGKWFKYLTNGLNMWELRLCVVDGLSILETALLCWKWLENLTNGLYMWEMTCICGKWLKYYRNG